MTIQGFFNELRNEDNVTYEHSVRCGNYLALFAKEIGKDDATVQVYREAGYLHDAGKLLNMDAIKSKVNIRELSERERNVYIAKLQRHVMDGKGIIKQITNYRKEYLEAADYHHCHFRDATRGYSGTQLRKEGKSPERSAIPEIAQMLAIVDVYDALSDPNRQYRDKAFSEEQITEIMNDNLKDGKFNPKHFATFTQKVVPLIKEMENEEKLKITIKDKEKTEEMRSKFAKEASVYYKSSAIKVEQREAGGKKPRYSGGFHNAM